MIKIEKIGKFDSKRAVDIALVQTDLTENAFDVRIRAVLYEAKKGTTISYFPVDAKGMYESHCKGKYLIVYTHKDEHYLQYILELLRTSLLETSFIVWSLGNFLETKKIDSAARDKTLPDCFELFGGYERSKDKKEYKYFIAYGTTFSDHQIDIVKNILDKFDDITLSFYMKTQGPWSVPLSSKLNFKIKEVIKTANGLVLLNGRNPFQELSINDAWGGHRKLKVVNVYNDRAIEWVRNNITRLSPNFIKHAVKAENIFIDEGSKIKTSLNGVDVNFGLSNHEIIYEDNIIIPYFKSKEDNIKVLKKLHKTGLSISNLSQEGVNKNQLTLFEEERVKRSYKIEENQIKRLFADLDKTEYELINNLTTIFKLQNKKTSVLPIPKLIFDKELLEFEPEFNHLAENLKTIMLKLKKNGKEFPIERFLEIKQKEDKTSVVLNIREEDLK